MELLYRSACGLDVHKETIVACIVVTDGRRAKRETRTFAAHTRGLCSLREWLLEKKVEAVGMEGTGIYWRPVYSLLEADAAWKLIVGNARHIKNVPGRKTDVKDAEWLADLVRHGLIRSSFVPPPEIRELRDLTRFRRHFVEDRVRIQNRILKVLQTANIKLDGVATDAFGVSGLAILRALANGNATPQEMAQLARGKMRKKIDALEVALEGRLSALHREMLSLALAHLDACERDIERLEEMIEERVAPYREHIERLVTIPGVDLLGAACALAEVGADMSVFPTEHHLSSWSGVCPGNHESAGRQQSGRTSKGNRYLKTLLCQLAQAAVRTKGTYLKDKFHRLKARRGHNRAIMAIAHKLLIAIYKVIKGQVTYSELGEAYLDTRDRSRTAASLCRRLEGLGYEVTLREQAAAPLLA